jgi:hypothetical protein
MHAEATPIRWWLLTLTRNLLHWWALPRHARAAGPPRPGPDPPGRRPAGARCLDAALDAAAPLCAALSSGAHACEVAAARTGDGRWLCTYTPPAAGFYRLTLALHGAPVGGSPFSVQAGAQRVPCVGSVDS